MKKIIIAIPIVIILLCIIIFGFRKQDNNQNNNSILHNKGTLSKYMISQVGSFSVRDIKCSILEEHKILDYYNNLLILDNYDMYETLFLNNMFYSNDEQCKKNETDRTIKNIKHYDSIPYYILEDNKIYYHSTYQEQHEGSPEFVEKTGFPYNILLNQDVVEFDVSHQYINDYATLFVLKTDGNIYEQKYKNDLNKPYEENILLSSETYGKILNFKYTGELFTRTSEIMIPETFVYIMTENGPYYGKYMRTEECTKYIDVDCKVELQKSNIIERYKNDVLFSNSNYIITKDYKIFNTSLLFED